MPEKRSKTVLVVDDEPNVRKHLAHILEDAGFRVRMAGDGEEAKRMIDEEQPDLVSLDLVMPRKSGRRLLYELRKDKRLSHIPVVVVTAHAEDELGRSDLDAIKESMVITGPGFYLEKPVRPADYVRCIRECLGIEALPEESEKLRLKEELDGELRKAEPHALRRALEALRRKKGGEDG